MFNIVVKFNINIMFKLIKEFLRIIAFIIVYSILAVGIIYVFVMLSK